jgi:hypothetical protein
MNTTLSIPRYVFRASQYLYVEVKERVGDWEYCIPDDGVEVHLFVEQLRCVLYSETRTGDSRLGVLARVPLGELEELGAEANGFSASSATSFRARVEVHFHVRDSRTLTTTEMTKLKELRKHSRLCRFKELGSIALRQDRLNSDLSMGGNKAKSLLSLFDNRLIIE